MAKSPSNIDVVVLALAQLGGATKKVNSEEVAARSFELAPAQFSWQLPKYRKRGWPDKRVAEKALVHAMTTKDGSLVHGNCARELVKDGWQLTPKGSEWIVEHEERIAEGLAAVSAKIPKREAQRFCKQIKNDPLFKKYAAGKLGSASTYEFTDLLVCSPDAPQETIQLKLQRLFSTAQLVKDDDILEFLDACNSRFVDVVSTQRGSCSESSDSSQHT